MSMKRSIESASDAASKREYYSENALKDSSFTPDTVPENLFPLGEGNYAVVSDFSDVIRVHLRFYKPDFSGNLKPTKRGISLTTSLWQALSSAMDIVPLREVKDMFVIDNTLLLAVELVNNTRFISFQRFFQRTDYTREFVPSICMLAESEWNELKKIRKIVSSYAVKLMFGRVFKGLLLCEARKRIPPVIVSQDDGDIDVLLTTSLSELLSEYLQSNIAEIFQCNGCQMDLGNQLGHDCVTLNNEMRATIYSDRAFLKIDMNKFISDYVDKNSQICNYINENFVQSLNMSNIVKTAVDLYIASDTNPLRMF